MIFKETLDIEFVLSDNGKKYAIVNKDFYYALQHVKLVISGRKVGQSWNVCVNLFDIYDFDTFRLTRDISMGDLANDLGLIMQNVAMIIPYNIRVYYFCTV